jgi:hypothetical protein
MATLDDLKIVLESINTNISGQSSVLSNILVLQQGMSASQQRASQLGSANRSSLGGALSGIGSIGTGIGSAVSSVGNVASGIGSGIGSAASGIGMGVGAAGLGIGALLAGGGYFLQALEDFDGAKVKENVLELFSISESFSAGMLQFFAEGGLFAAAMTGIGIGLASFGVGSAAAGLADALNNYLGVDNWAQSVKDNVLTLLSISDAAGGNIDFLLTGGTFGLAMTGLALGLAAFGVGSGIAGIGEVLARFGGGEEWAQNTKNNVLTLLSISDSLGGKLESFGETGTFLAVMSGIAAGLALFGAGSAGVGIAELINNTDWAQKIKDDVGILMSIEDSLGGTAEAFGETGTFLAAMTGIGTGLAVFGAGSAISGLSALMNDEDWALKIKSDVLALLSIGDSLPGDDTFIGESSKFFLSMVGIGAGLTAFAAGNFVGTMANAVTAVLSFFGVDSPFEQLMKLADNADELTQGADALDRLTVSLDKIGQLQFDGKKLRIREFAEDLKEAVPIIEAAIMGEEGGYIFGAAIKGLASPDVDYDTAIKNIVMLRQALSGVVSEDTVSGIATVNGAGAGGGAQQVNVNVDNSDNSVTSSSINGGSPATTVNVIGSSRSDLDFLSRPSGAQ